MRAALVGIEGKLIDFDRGVEVEGAEMARAVIDDLREHAQELGCERRAREPRGPDRARHGRARASSTGSTSTATCAGLMREIVDASAP